MMTNNKFYDYFRRERVRQKFESEKNVTHRHSQHTVCDGVSGVTEEGYLPGVPVCLVSVRGSATHTYSRTVATLLNARTLSFASSYSSSKYIEVSIFPAARL